MWRIVLCLVGAPILGLWAGAAANPPGNGPGVGGALLGVGLPALVSVTAVRLGGGSWVAAVSWAIASVVTTGLVLVLLILFVAYVVRPA